MDSYHSRKARLEPDAFSQKEVDKAWDKFLSQRGDVSDLTARDMIVNSWGRCLSLGVNPDQLAAPKLATEGSLHVLRSKNSELIECARPVLEQAHLFLHDLKTVLFLTDYQGVNLQVVGDPRTIEDAVGIGLVEGSGWNETVSGSNAVGTAMATRKPTQIHGEEHYCQGFKPWTCTAAIISDPYDKQMLGVIDVSGLRDVFDKFHVPLVVAWASQIQASLAKKTYESWSLIQQNCDSNFARSSNSDKLVLDTQGRLVSHSENTAASLNTLGIDYDPLSKGRLSMERFGGEEIVYPHDQGLWISDDWVEPIKHKSEIVGFQVNIPNPQKSSRKTPARVETQKHNKATSDPFSEIFGESASFKASADKARQVAITPLPVLILGETGVGKEVFARAIHEASNYSDGPFIDLNCGAFTKEILSSELFGHVEGAFTGSKKGGMMGKIEAANGGTLFLDEIGEMPLEIQPIFLRVLQERKIYRVGDIKPIPVSFRLIAATNSDLKKDVAEGRFRKDLFFRIATVTLSLDPLSGRKDDIEGISHLVLNRIRKSHEIVPQSFSPDLMKALKNREWPGNIRELVNVVECMCYMSQHKELTLEDLPEGYKPGDVTISAEPVTAVSGKALCSLDLAEKQTIEAAIKQSGGNLTQSAKTLGIAKSTLYQKMKKYGLERPSRM